MSFKIPYKDTRYYSRFILDYLDEDKKLRPFVDSFPRVNNFRMKIESQKDRYIDRDTLVKVLKRQNDYLSLSTCTKENIDLLRMDTSFTVTTGHQLCLFAGPLYFIYKIISAINLCEQLNESYPSNKFIPFFWMASEDHDFNEINHIHLFRKKIEWNTNQNGPVGRMSLDGFERVIDELKLALGSHKNAEKVISIFQNSYLHNNNLSDATRYLVNELFGEYGLVIIDGDDKYLKRKFVPQMKKDILNKGFVDTINSCTNNLSKNYRPQAFIRDINFFKLLDGGRELIKKDVIEQEIDENPERFSPNVLLRPLYQETVLPNIAYVGGGAEIAYWLQLKTAFEQESIPFPVLILRNSALLLDEKQHNHISEDLGFELEEIFLSEDELNKRYVLANSNEEISFKNEKGNLDLLYQNISSKTSDLGLKNSIEAQLQKNHSFLDNIQKKIIRIEKKKHQVAINRISKLKRHLFPYDSLQERYDSFIPYYLKNGDNFIKRLKNNFDPLDPNFVVLTL